jgi:hypothetical protein
MGIARVRERSPTNEIKASELPSSALGRYDQIHPFERISVSQSDKHVTKTDRMKKKLVSK